MFQQIEKSIAAAVAAHVRTCYGVEFPVVLEQPEQTAFGEFAIPVAFQLARQLKKAPRAIAQELIAELPPIVGVARLEVAGNGYINARLDRGLYAAGLLSGEAAAHAPSTGGKNIVEHTNIHPNQAVYIGHLRTAILGDTVVRMLRSMGAEVEVLNHIDNTCAPVGPAHLATMLRLGVVYDLLRPESEILEPQATAFEQLSVIDSRQAHRQSLAAAGLCARSVHFCCERVALSPRTCVEMGIELSEEDQRKPYVEVCGRNGPGVQADDLIDKLIEKALRDVNARHPEDTEEQRREVATQIAVGALRYFLLRFPRNSVIALDLQEALSFEGETGPYVQYAAVRARNIPRKLAGRGLAVPDFRTGITRESFARRLAQEDLWQLLLALSKLDVAIARAIDSGEPAHVARYAFQQAQAFNNFYHGYPVLSEQDPEKRVFLLWLCDYFHGQLDRALALLGIEAPEHV